MIKTLSELRDFISICRQAKIKAAKFGDVQVEFSELAFIDAIAETEPNSGTEERDTSKTLVDSGDAESDEDLLFWSAKG